MYRFRVLFILLLIIMATASAAQENSDDQPLITIEAQDGLSLRGEFFPSANSDGRAILLLHQLYTTRSSWNSIVESLRASGYHVLAVDLRGYGATGGRINWTRAQQDTQSWLNWLSEQPGVRGDALYVMGASMGSSLALVGCAQSERCVASVAISPGRSYFGVSTDAAIQSGKPTLLIFAERDTYPRRAVPVMQAMEGFNGEVISYPGRDHGMLLLRNQDDLLGRILEWLGQR